MQRPTIVLIAILTASSLVWGNFASADVIAPGSAAGSIGNAQGPAPLTYHSSGGGARTQQVYDASLFPASTSQLITGIAFRPADVPASFFTSNTVSFSDVTVSLGTTSKSGEGSSPLGATFADNIGSPEQTVYSGPLTLTTAQTGPPGGPFAFDYVISLTTPFLYNPAAGNLLLDVTVPTNATVTGPGFGFITFDTVNTTNDGIYSVTNISNGGAATGIASTAGAITEFISTSASLSSVPEPSSIALAISSLVGLAVFGWRRRSR
jgi:hypothetical protein